MQKVYKNIRLLTESLLILENVEVAFCGEAVEIGFLNDTSKKFFGEVIEIDRHQALVQVFGSIFGVGAEDLCIKFLGENLMFGASGAAFGRIFNGNGIPADKRAQIIPEKYINISKTPISPYLKIRPSESTQMEISAINLFSGGSFSIVLDEKNAYPAIAEQIEKQSKHFLENTSFSIVVGIMGVSSENVSDFQRNLETYSLFEKSVFFVNTISDPITERILIPRITCSFAEYLAFEKQKQVLVIFVDLLSYQESLRVISADHKKILGYSGHYTSPYTEISDIFGRFGKMNGGGSVTQLLCSSVNQKENIK